MDKTQKKKERKTKGKRGWGKKTGPGGAVGPSVPCRGSFLRFKMRIKARGKTDGKTKRQGEKLFRA